jgi:uncharacterized protein
MTYRILSLDGGGTWALLQAIALAETYGHEASGHDVLSRFDMAVANSGGSIVLAGLMADFPLARLIALFGTAEQVQGIFVKLNLLEKLANPTAKYSTEKKLAGLSAILGAAGERMLDAWEPELPAGPGGAPVKAMIVGFDYDSQRAEFFRTFATGLGASPSHVRLVDAVHASSDAPVAYFNRPTSCGSPPRRYWDGAVAGFNNPLMAGLAEAIALGVDPATIRLLSIGTGTVRLAPPDSPAPDELRQTQHSPSVLGDLQELAGSITDDPPDTATYTAYVTLNHVWPPPMPSDGGPVVRMNPVVRPILANGQWTPPPGYDLAAFKAIAGLAMDAREQPEIDNIKRLGAAWVADAVPNQPIRAAPDSFERLIGDATFQAAKARWLQMT